MLSSYKYIVYFYLFYLLIVKGSPSGHKSHNRALTLFVALRLVEFTERSNEVKNKRRFTERSESKKIYITISINGDTNVLKNERSS